MRRVLAAGLPALLLLPLWPGRASGHEELDLQIARITGQIESHPGDALLHLRRGELYRIDRDWARAMADFERAERLDGTLAGPALARGRLLFETGHPRRAEAELERLLEAAPDHAPARLWLARVLAATGRREESLREYRRAIVGLSPPRPEHYLEWVALLDPAEGIEALRQGSGRLGSPVTLELEAAALERRLGRTEESRARIARIGTAAPRGFVSVARRAEFPAGAPAARAAVTRGPYLQSGTPSAVVVRWRTDTPTDSRVLYGTDLAALSDAVVDPTPATEHVVALSGLSPSTHYFYAVGSTSAILAGPDPDTCFTTSPPTGSSKPTRIWILGDSGTADANARAVRDAYSAYAGSRRTDLWLMLGDNAYTTGTDAEYQAAVFDMYPGMLRKSVLWPTLGNHDGLTADSATQSGPYYDIFTLPSAGEAGGLSSGTEAYYSFDYGHIHFICLESYETDRTPGGAMMTWLLADAAATTQPWIIAFWHHPPYSKGSHDSDVEARLIDMRQNALPILEQAGVDLVLTGHSHSYERSVLLDGHYGLSPTLVPSMVKDGGPGPYRKAAAAKGPNEGAVYAVAGSSGLTSGGPLNHPAMLVSLNELGSMVFDVDGRRLDAKFLRSDGTIGDSFTMVKGPSAVTLTAPNGTENWLGSGPWTVTWTSDGAVANVEILLSVDGGETYPHVLAASTPDDGSEEVILPPGLSSARSRVRICDASDPFAADWSDGDFSVSTPPAPGPEGRSRRRCGLLGIEALPILLAWGIARHRR